MTHHSAPKGLSELAEAFNQLNLDEKAAFLVKAAFSTAATALDDIGSRIDEMISSMADSARAEAQDNDDDGEPSESKSSESAPPESS